MNEKQRKALFSVGLFIVGVLVAWGLLALISGKGMPPGPILNGVIYGALGGLPALGLVLIYRSAKIINFAQVEIGGASAVVTAVLILGLKTSYIVGMLGGLLFGLVVGLLIDRIIVWRFQNAPRLVLTVATIGLLQVMEAIEYELPNQVPQNSFNNPNGLNAPFHLAFSLNGFPFNENSVVAIGVTVIAVALLALLITRTDVGSAIRASSDSPERAVLLGMPVRSLSMVSWVVACGLSALFGILSQPIIGFSPGNALGPSALLLPLAAAAIGRFESLPVTFAASIVLGIFNQAVFFAYGKSTSVDLGFFVAIFLALSLQRANYQKVWDVGLGAFRAFADVRPVPQRIKNLVQYKVISGVGLIVCAAIAIVIPAINASWMSQATLIDLTTIVIYAIIAVSLVVLTGWAGQLSFGQFAFVAAGAAATAVALDSWHLNVALALVFSLIVGTVLAIFVGIPGLRLPGLNLAVITFAFAELVDQYFINASTFPVLAPSSVNFGPLFGRINLYSYRAQYYVALVVLVLVGIGARNMLRTRVGRVIRAIRDNERAGAAYGASPLRAKLIAFGYSGAAAGIAGGLYAISLQVIPAGGFPPDASINVFAMVVVGGMGSLIGGVLGAIIFESIYFATQNSPALETGVTGILFLIVLLIIPNGIGGTLYSIRDWILDRIFKPGDDPLVATTDSKPTSVIPGPAQEAVLRITALEDLEIAGKRIRQVQSVQVGDPKAAALSAIDVDAGYGRAQILYGVSVDVKPGEILALLGTNGAGKSTLLRVYSGLLKPKHGSVYLNGQEITSLDPIERVKLGLVTVPGGRGVFKSLTVKENLRLAGWMYKKDRAHISKTLSQVFALFPTLQKRLEVKAELLSGGEQQMLTLAQSLFCKPKVLLIDELSIGLAPTVVAELLNAVTSMASQGITLIIVEQSVNVATAIADRAVFMERGQVRFSGPTPSLEQQPNLLRSVFLRAATRSSARPRSEHEAQRFIKRQDVPAFGVANVNKRFGNVLALDDVSFSVQKSEIVGIIGANGAGKTTLFDVCSGFLTPDSGRVFMEGVSITALVPYQRAIRGLGRVFQDAQLFPTLTVAEVLAVALERHVEVRDPLASILGLKAVLESEKQVKARVEELLELMGLTRFRNNFVSELSTGTRRIVDLACAIAHRPRVLLLDEPSSGIAQRESEAMGELLLSLRSETGATFVVIEHDVPLVSYISDRLICMHLGQIIAQGEVQSVLSNPEVISAYLGRDETAIKRSSFTHSPTIPQVAPQAGPPKPATPFNVPGAPPVSPPPKPPSGPWAPPTSQS